MRNFSAFLRIGTSLAMFFSIIWQVTDRVAHNVFRPTEYFEYFTIQTGLISATVLLFAGIKALRSANEDVRWAVARLSVVTYEIVVGIIYNLLLRDSAPDVRDGDYNWPALPNEILHVWAPILITLDWLLSTGMAKIAFKRVWWVLVYPVVWLAFMFSRGAIDGWYPYWFFSPKDSDAVTITMYIFGIMFFMIAVGNLMTWIQRLRVGKHRTSQ
jgi:hypothetical protein